MCHSVVPEGALRTTASRPLQALWTHFIPTGVTGGLDARSRWKYGSFPSAERCAAFPRAHWIYWIYASLFAYVFAKYAQLGDAMPWISFGSPRICGPGRRLRDIAGPRRQRWGLVLGTKPSPVSRAPSGRSRCFYRFGRTSCASTA